MYGGEFLKEGESTYWLKAGSFQTGRHGVSEEDWSSGIPAGVRISISFNPLGVAGVLFCFRPVVPANERTGTKDPLCGSSIN